MSNTENLPTGAFCDYCDNRATSVVKLDTLTANVRYGLEYLVCDDCIVNAEMAMEDQGYLPNEYYTTAAWA